MKGGREKENELREGGRYTRRKKAQRERARKGRNQAVVSNSGGVSLNVCHVKLTFFCFSVGSVTLNECLNETPSSHVGSLWQ